MAWGQELKAGPAEWLASTKSIGQKIATGTDYEDLEKDCYALRMALLNVPNEISRTLPLSTCLDLGRSIKDWDEKFVSPARVDVDAAYLEMVTTRLAAAGEMERKGSEFWICLDLEGGMIQGL